MRSLVSLLFVLALLPMACFFDGGGDSSGPAADAPQHCVNRAEALCRRERQRCIEGGMTPLDTCNTDYVSCTTPIAGGCSGATWPSSCVPTQSAADACIDALLDPSTLSIADADVNRLIPDCARVVCGR
jgi:hypothetical protein